MNSAEEGAPAVKNRPKKRTMKWTFSFVWDEIKRRLTNRQVAIMLTMLLFALITCAQVGAAIIANSLALLGDCGSMAVDTISYAVNLWAECVEIEHQQRNQLIATSLSILVLLAITGYVIYSAIVILLEGEADDDDVNVYIVFAFALGGLLFDFIGLYALWRGKKEESTTAGNLNLYSAGMHVLADLMRSTTTLIESILIWFCNFESTGIDAVAALIVSVLILLPCMQMSRQWLREYHRYRSGMRELAPTSNDEKSSKKHQRENVKTVDYYIASA